MFLNCSYFKCEEICSAVRLYLQKWARVCSEQTIIAEFSMISRGRKGQEVLWPGLLCLRGWWTPDWWHTMGPIHTLSPICQGPRRADLSLYCPRSWQQLCRPCVTNKQDHMKMFWSQINLRSASVWPQRTAHTLRMLQNTVRDSKGYYNQLKQSH